MPTGSRKFARNIDINRGNILLLFNDHQAKIARDWQVAKKHGGAKDDRDAASRGLGGRLVPGS